MSLPDAIVEPQDGGLRLAPSSIVGIHAKVGACSAGVAGAVVGLSSPSEIEAAFGVGPLANALADSFAAGARVIYAVRVVADAPGVPGSVTAGATNTSPGSVLPGEGALDAFDVKIEILKGGDKGVATFRYSLDNGMTWADPALIPAQGGVVLPNSGITLTFSDAGEGDSFVEGDTWTFSTTAPGSLNGTSLAVAIDALLASEQDYEWVHVVGPSTSTEWAIVEAKLRAAEAQHVFMFAIYEAAMPASGATGSVYAAACAATSLGHADIRGAIVAAPVRAVCPLTGRHVKRQAAGFICGHLARMSKLSRSLGRVREGALPVAIQGLLPEDINDANILTLDQARFVTLRKFRRWAGFYVTNGRMMAPGQSDYRWIEWRRVMNHACREVRAAKINSVHDEATPAGIGALRADMQAPIDRMIAAGYIEAGEVTIRPGQDVIATGELEVDVAIKPIAAMRTLRTRIRFAQSL